MSERGAGQIAASVDSVGASAPDRNSYAVDGFVPKLVVRIGSESEAVATLNTARNAGHAVVANGGRSHMTLGNVPARYDIALDLCAMDRVVEHEPADLTVTVQAGVRLADLQRMLEASGQRLPVDPPGGDGGTVGGAVASNAYGPLRHAFGTVRDWLIGVRVVHADGSVSKAGGRVVKNVAGYEMTKLYVGSLGTLAVISEMTFKLSTLSATTRTIAIASDAAGVGEIALTARDTGLSLQRAELLSPPTSATLGLRRRWCLLLDVAGSAAAVDRSLRELRTLAAAHGGEIEDTDDAIWERWRTLFASADLVARASVLPSRVAAIARDVAGLPALTEPALSATATAGIVRVAAGITDAAAMPAVEQLRAACTAHGGSLVVDAAPLDVKRHIDVFGGTRGDFSLMQRLKEQFDPERILSPGRFVGRL